LPPVRGRFQDVLAFLRRFGVFLAFSKRQKSFWRFRNVDENAQQTVRTFVTALEAFRKTAVMFGHFRNGQIVAVFLDVLAFAATFRALKKCLNDFDRFRNMPRDVG